MSKIIQVQNVFLILGTVRLWFSETLRVSISIKPLVSLCLESWKGDFVLAKPRDYPVTDRALCLIGYHGAQASRTE